MGSELGIRRLGDVAKVRSGFAFKSSDMGDRGCPVIKIKNIKPPDVDVADVQRVPLSVITGNPRIEKFRLMKGDVLIAMTGATVGKVGRMPEVTEDHYLNQRVGKVFVHDSENAHLDYIYYVLSQDGYVDQMFGLADGSAQANISGTQIEHIEIPLPPLPEQKAIAHILGTLDDKIELNRKRNETLEAMARALFKDWFVDFGPVRAKMEDREPYLPADLWSLFPDCLDDNGKPAGWTLVAASELIEFNPTEPLRKGTPTPYLSMASLPTSGSWPEPPVIRDFGSGMRFRNGDTLLARITPCLENGKAAFIQCLPEDTVGWGSTEYIVMRSKAPVPSEYAYLLARDSIFREHAIRSMTGTSGRQRAQGDSIAAFKLASPPDKNLWHAFGAQVAPMFRSIRSNARANETLAQLRDTLLPKLVSGEMRIADAEKFMQRAGCHTSSQTRSVS